MYQTRLTLKPLLLGLLFAFAVVAAPGLSGPAHAGYEGQEDKAKAITLGQPNLQTQEVSQRQPEFQAQGAGGRDDVKAKALPQGQPDFQTQEVSQRDPNFQAQGYDWSDD